MQELSKGHFTVMDGSKADSNLVLIQTFLLYYGNRDYFMVGECVRFLFTSCEESKTHSFAALTRSFSILHNS